MLYTKTNSTILCQFYLKKKQEKQVAEKCEIFKSYVLFPTVINNNT